MGEVGEAGLVRVVLRHEAPSGVSFEHMNEQCEATKMRPTATGEVEAQCTKAAGHVAAGDLEHEGKTGVFPIRWRD